MRSLPLHLCLVSLLAACSQAPSADEPKAAPREAPAIADVRIAANADAWLAHVRKLVADAEAAGAATIPGTGDDLLLVNELRSLIAGPFWGEAAQTASRAAQPERRDPLPAILDFDRQLKQAGIEWVFVPVPAKVAVDPTLVPGAPAVDGRVDVQVVAFFAELRRQGVPVLDVLPALRELVARGERAHCRTDTHWTPRACAVVAELVHRHFEAGKWLREASRRTFATTSGELQITGDMAAMRKAETAPEQLPIVRVPDSRVDPQSPVLLFGDSHCLVFHNGGDMHAEHAGLPDHLEREFGIAIDVLGVRGSGATPSRVDAYRGKRFAGKQAAIWCLTAREFTEGQGWALVPIGR